jgi:chemotaxis protein MotB
MTRLWPLAVSIALAGCVTQGTFDALQAEHDKTVHSLADRDKEVADLKASLAAEQAKSADAAARISKLEGDLANTLKDRSSLQASVEEMKNALAELQKRKVEADARIAEFRGLLDKFKSLIDAGKLKVKIADGRMVVELATDVLFASGSARLSDEGKAAVIEVSGVLASIPNRAFQVEGHTDNVPISTAQYRSNWDLASARAITVLKAMAEAGMPENRISAASYGESKPARANDSPEGKSANRRIEIVVVPDLSSLPGFDELKHVSGST